MFHNCRVRVLSAAVAGVVGLVASQRTQAATPDFLYVGQTTSQTVSTGGAVVSLNLFLLANTPAGVSLMNNNSGLLSAGVAVNVASHTGAGNPSSIASYALDTTDFGGPSLAPVISATSMEDDTEAVGTSSTTGATFGNTAAGTVVNPAANNMVFLGTVSLKAGDPGTTTVFNIGENDGPPPSDGGYTLTFKPAFAAGGGYDLDDAGNGNPGTPFTGVGSNVSSFSLTVGSVPEPGTLGLLGFGSMLGLLRRRRLA